MVSKPLFYTTAVLLGVFAAVLGSVFFHHNDMSELLRTIDSAKIYYFYSDYCPHCREVKPYISKLAGKYSITYCNVLDLSDECAGIKKKLNIEYIPTLVFITDESNYVFTGSNEVINVINAVEGIK
ncbi:thioredoxin family protein [Archaeoglobus neptunius]|uniref:thioredoxin family protein n=1 Tax=Archaeoglobus neptunius TaxID=2798580 RepID=UPI0019284421|nr:thioredoxin family protein [Archaeoglobus neptunius]